MIVMVTSEASDGYERRLRAKRVMVVFNDTPMEEGSGVFFLTLLTSSSLCPHSLLWRKVLECSSSLLTSSSLCPHSLLWRKVLECSSSHCSLRHPCVLTHSYGGSFWSVLPHCSLRHPCVLTHFVIPVFSHP